MEASGDHMKLTDLKITLACAACVAALAIVSAEVLHIRLDFISQLGPVWVLIGYFSGRQRLKGFYAGSIFWSSAMVLLTAIILVRYALQKPPA